LKIELEKWMEGRALLLDPTITRLPKEIKKNKIIYLKTSIIYVNH